MRVRTQARNEQANLNLDPNQKAAAWTKAKVAVIWASPGGGKTRIATERIGWLVRRNVKPERIGFLAFTNRAAQEGLERLRRTNPACRRVQAQTIHAFANFLVRKYRDRLGQADYRILSQERSERIVKRLAGKTDLPAPFDLCAIRSLAINSKASINEVVRRRWPSWISRAPAIEKVLSDYEAKKRRQRVLDFDDLLVCAIKVADWLIAHKASFKFNHLIIDETQDLSAIQLELLSKLSKSSGRKLSLYFVGDPHQSIFGFRGAFPEVFERIKDLWPEAKFMTLSGSYRSNQGILDLASAIEKPLFSGGDRPLVARRLIENHRPVLRDFPDEIAEVNGLFETIKAKVGDGIPLTDQVILFRSSSDISLIRQQANYTDIPIRVIGGDQRNRRFGLEWLRAILVTAIEKPPPTTLATLLKPFSKKPNNLTKEILRTAPRNRAALFAHLKGKMDGANFRGLRTLVKAVSVKSASVSNRVKTIIEIVSPFFNALNPAQAKGWVIDIRVLNLTKVSSIRALIDAIDLQTAEPVEDDDRLVVSSVHSAKGRQWRVVYLPGLVEGKMPNHHARAIADIAEERRIFFVAVTRAEEFLCLSMARRRKVGGWGNSARSRFLDPSVLAQVDRIVVKASRPLPSKKNGPSSSRNRPLITDLARRPGLPRLLARRPSARWR